VKGAISMAENTKANIPTVPEMKLELVPIPVSDVDRAKVFYEKAGFQLEVDTRPTDTMRVVQLTPPANHRPGARHAAMLQMKNRHE